MFTRHPHISIWDTYQLGKTSTQCWLGSFSASAKSSYPHKRSVLWVKYSKEIGVLWSCQTRPYTVSIYTATVEQLEFKYRCWVWILFFIWNAWIIERERRWGGIHSRDGWSGHRFPPCVSGLLNGGAAVHFVHVSPVWVLEGFRPKNS